ncbi:MAG: hypothetical protein ABSB40_11455 [Nitrososphaeria archaeon]
MAAVVPPSAGPQYTCTVGFSLPVAVSSPSKRAVVVAMLDIVIGRACRQAG